MRLLPGLFMSIAFSMPAFAGRPMTVDDLLAVKSVSDPQISPDGKLVVYVVSEIDREANKSNSDLWLVPVAGGEPKRLTTAPGADSHPRWSPDGKSIAFTSTRSGSSQIWLLSIDGGEAQQLTRLPIDVSEPIWSPKGDKLAFAAEVVPGKSPEETAKADKAKADAKSKVRVYDSLMIRHWASWDEGKKSHLFVCDARTGEAKDLIPDWKVNVPPGPFGGSSDYAWSPDGKELAFTSEPLKDHAWSTNTDIWTIPAEGGTAKNRTAANKGADAQPSYCPIAKFRLLAFVSQERAGFEADQWVLKLAAADQEPVDISKRIDRPVQSFVWYPGIPGWNRLLATIDERGTEPLMEIGFSVRFENDGKILSLGGPAQERRLMTGGINTAAQVGPDGESHIFLRGDASRPSEIFHARIPNTAASPGRLKIEEIAPTQLTHHNDDLIAKLDVSKAEGFSFKGADGDEVHGWLIKPPGFDPSKKYPVLFAIHGGPQGAWHDEWHARWNYQMFAAPGYVVVAINPRGSTGYGQKFTDQISTDWNGRVVEDLMKGLDHATKTYPFLDGDRVAAAGGSYGGYMVNWLAGHSDRFKALISHAGVFDLTSKYGTTEELWFPDWEFGGPPWKDAETATRYREQSPSSYAMNFKTPTLVIHGALDFRVPDAQGLGMFTALQRRGVPSRYVWFPDEGHWILKPANRVAWWNEMHSWLAKYLK
ncbi:MAG: dipeptidyl aminopeptidase/acylaminoacyl peptidase [Planctomycetota bacterium]|nr:dipeptidyl aminopeptidase/acylaminoacyl peptidase [Planctomycetota bacterium]